MVETNTTTQYRDEIIEMFLDATPNESYARGRITTIEDENTVALVTYHNEIIAQVNRAADSVTLFTGHYGSVSPTVDNYLSALGKRLNERDGFDVTVLEGHAPTTGYGVVAEAAQYIGNSLGPFDERSPAERTYGEQMEKALAELV